ncbi:helix-turn-helix domain-containing protein [Bacillus subtilis]|uniref:helix-turn-helix domain-containing protein n=1 Tax=Bacillus subtilis TaxID=1423 RepID=UPI003CF6DFB2
MEDNKKNFGRYIKSLREEKGYSSQRSLAEASGVGNKTIARIENGESGASEETLQKLSKALDVSYEDLIEKQLGSGDNALHEKIKRLKKDQVAMVSNIIDEFMRLNGENK